MPDPGGAELSVLDALHELVDVSQALGLHAPSPTEREQVHAKLEALREHLARARVRTGTPATLHDQLHRRVEALVRLLAEQPHSIERWREARASLVECYEELRGSLRSRPGFDHGGRRRIKPHNLRRTLFHAGSGIAWAFAYEVWLERWQMLLALVAFLVLFVTDDVMRRWFPDRRGRFAVTVFQLLSRPSESAKIASSTWYTAGMLVGVLVLPSHAFLLGLLVLALADPAAALVGRRFGRHKLYRDKSMIGTATFFVVAMAIAMVLLAMRVPGLGPQARLGTAALIALAGTIAELLGDHLQDNASILLATGITAALLL